MLRRNSLFKKTWKIVNKHKNQNSCLSTTIRQDQCSSDSKHNNTYHYCLFTVLFSKFNPKYGQVIKINDRFNINMIAALWHVRGITITKYLFASSFCIMVCYVLFILHMTCSGHTVSTAHAFAWLSMIQSRQTKITIT